MRPEFTNEPFVDFSQPENKSAFEAALRKVSAELGGTHPIVIGGERITTAEQIRSINPSKKSQTIAVFSSGTKEMALKAVETAHTTFGTWSKTPAAERAEYLFKASDILRKRKHEFSATMVYEAGKSWPEADADTAETIDFLEFYAREMLRYAADQPLTELPGEDNRLEYIPLGVGAVIPPWNFPLAIMAGMTMAAVVTGNTVVLKPSSDAPYIAWKFFMVLEEVGLPKGVVNFLPGSGSVVGNVMVEHPKTRFIAFTGSKETGLSINRKAADTQDGQIWIKRVVAEMGGKDSIIVDSEADLDAAVAGVRLAAFGFSGQKCSACSRAIVDEKLYDAFLEKLVPQVKAIKVGPVDDPTNYTGPVINGKAFKSIMGYIEAGVKQGRLVAGGEGDDSQGFFIQPTVIADTPPDGKISLEEIFGPVLAVIKAKDYDDALRIANNTEFGLTGAVYSKNEAKLKRAASEFHVGNLYLNRKCTGALVGVHPFGGFNMSGTDSKAGGRDYLLLFLQAKCVSRLIS